MILVNCFEFLLKTWDAKEGRALDFEHFDVRLRRQAPLGSAVDQIEIGDGEILPANVRT